MRRKHICGRDPDTGPGSCPFWWESCQAMRRVPIGCFLIHAMAQPNGTYQWMERWRNPRTGAMWPPMSFDAATDAAAGQTDLFAEKAL